MKTPRTLSIAAGLLAATVTSLTAGITAVQAEPKGKTLTLFVAIDGTSFASIASSNPDAVAFSVAGDIFDPNVPLFDPNDPSSSGSPIGTFDGRGWIFFDSGVQVKETMSHVYAIGVDTDSDGLADEGFDLLGGSAPELGAIMTQGREFFVPGKGFFAVIGGTKDFSNVGGEGEMNFTGAGFEVEFRLTGSFN